MLDCDIHHGWHVTCKGQANKSICSHESRVTSHGPEKSGNCYLGLAIVKKILEDHGGTLSLSDRVGGGAAVLVSFPLDAATLNVADSGKAHAAAGSA